MLNALYVIDDTEHAKASFNKFQLQRPCRHDDIGEKYLRLYGLLNAVYQQKLAIENLLEIYKIKDKKNICKELSSNNLIQIRNKIGSHSSNFKSESNDSEHTFDVYEIIRHELNDGNIILIKNQKDNETYNLGKEIKEFDCLIEDVLDSILGKIIKKLFQNQGKDYSEYQNIQWQKKGI